MSILQKMEDLIIEEQGERAKSINGGPLDNVELAGLSGQVGEMIAVLTVKNMSCELLGWDSDTEECLKHLHKARKHLMKASETMDRGS